MSLVDLLRLPNIGMRQAALLTELYAKRRQDRRTGR
jgi:hypothetical protein